MITLITQSISHDIVFKVNGLKTAAKYFLQLSLKVLFLCFLISVDGFHAGIKGQLLIRHYIDPWRSASVQEASDH